MTTSDPVQPNHRILVVDDNEGIHLDLRKVLAHRSGFESELDPDTLELCKRARVPPTLFEIDSAYQGKEGLEMLHRSVEEGRPYALAFVDIRMPPGWDGVETITHFWKICPELQVVICTGYADYSWDALATRLTALSNTVITTDLSDHATPQLVPRLGDSDNLIIIKKPFDHIVVLQLAHSLTRKWQVTRQAQLRLEDLDRLVIQRTAAQQAANEQFRLAEKRFSKAFGANPIPLALQHGEDGRFVDVNHRLLVVTGYSYEEVVGQTPAELHLWPEESPGAAWIAHPPGTSGLQEFTCQFRTRTGELRDALVSTEDLEKGPGSHRLLILQDITDRVRLENRLRQAQKLESVGQLAGGIAHDFNNVLAVILGNLSLAKIEMNPGTDAFLALQAAEAGALRAKDLTTQLLTFAKGGKPVKNLTSLEQIIRDSAATALNGSNTRYHLNSTPDLWPIPADAGQLSQVFNNLFSNSRQAMNHEGLISIDLSNLTITPDDNRPMKEGHYVQVSFQDHGEGITRELLPRIFDPYFTTRKTGSGLGLAVVYSIVKGHQGNIIVESDPGVRTTFTLLLPAAEHPVPTLASATPTPTPKPHHRILVMDDEDMVRTLLSKMLARVGYDVEAVADGAAAVAAYSDAQARSRPFDLVIMDLTIPGGMGGQEAIQRLLEIDPNVKAIVSSGYSENPVMADHKAYGFCGVAPKPYTFEQLNSALQKALNS